MGCVENTLPPRPLWGWGGRGRSAAGGGRRGRPRGRPRPPRACYIVFRLAAQFRRDRTTISRYSGRDEAAEGEGSGGGHKHRPSNVGERPRRTPTHFSPHGRPHDARGRGEPSSRTRVGPPSRMDGGGGAGRSFRARRRRRPSSTVICVCAPSGQALRRRGTHLSLRALSQCRPGSPAPSRPPVVLRLRLHHHQREEDDEEAATEAAARLRPSPHPREGGGDPYARSGGGGGGGADLWSSSVMSVVRRARPPRTPLWPRPAPPLPGPPLSPPGCGRPSPDSSRPPPSSRSRSTPSSSSGPCCSPSARASLPTRVWHGLAQARLQHLHGGAEHSLTGSDSLFRYRVYKGRRPRLQPQGHLEQQPPLFWRWAVPADDNAAASCNVHFFMLNTYAGHICDGCAPVECFYNPTQPCSEGFSWPEDQSRLPRVRPRLRCRHQRRARLCFPARGAHLDAAEVKRRGPPREIAFLARSLGPTTPACPPPLSPLPSSCRRSITPKTPAASAPLPGSP